MWRSPPSIGLEMCVLCVGIYWCSCLSKILWTDAVKIIKLTIRPIGRHHLRSSSLPHLDTGHTVSSICVRMSSTLFDSSWISSVVSIRRPFNFTRIVSFLEVGRSHRAPNQGSTVCGGRRPFRILPETAGWGRKCETGRCAGEAARSVLAKVRGDVFARFYAVAAKVSVEPGIHSLACWDKFFVLPQLLYRWRHQCGIFWILPRCIFENCLFVQRLSYDAAYVLLA
jgi:hypothetical protein